MMSTLRLQNFSIIGQGVPEIQGVTHRQTQDEDLLYRLEFQIIRISDYQNFRLSEFQIIRISDYKNFRLSEFQIIRISDY